MKLRDKNINTISFWNKKYRTKEFCNRNIFVEMDRFFSFGFIPKHEKVSVLDLGCGYAWHFDRLAEKYPLVTWYGTELSTLATALNNRDFPKYKFWQQDICDSEPFPVTVDYIMTSHVFEHLNDPLCVFEKCKKAARKKVIVCVPYGTHKNEDGEHMHSFDLAGPLPKPEEYVLIKDATFTDIITIENAKNAKEIFYVFDGEAK
jgi:SAM-dependent methyltransferase